MKHTIKFIIVLFSLVVTGTTSVWGITEDDIIVNVLPNSSAGTVTVAVSGMNVTITATPATDYFIDASHIIAEKMVEPSVSHHAPGLSSSLPISGSNPFTFTIPDGYTGAYVTVNFYKKTEGFTQITSLSEITDMNGKYQLTADVSGISSSLGEFKGTLDGGLHKIIGSSAPLFTSTDGAIIRNLIFEDVNITSGDNDGDAGAITSKAKGATRIYNCGILPTSAERDNEGIITGFYGSSVSGTRYVGSLVGFLDGTSRVINCYSYANVSGGSYVGGIVGYNNVSTTATNLKTMVMNCMFYGEVSGSSIAPIYNGAIITNVGDGENTGVSNYNYFRLESSYIQNTAITKVYNCALGAETRFLQRFEFFRHVLNSHRELAAWWATGSMDNKDEMMKWVLEPTQISSSAPFPILKAPGYYPSVVNIDAENAPTTTERNKGGKLGTLSVTIQSGSGEVFSAPTGASITKSNLTLNITDKDFDHFNFNYYKVQLPYYNEVGTGNYTKASDGTGRVVTGWKIVSITGGTPGTFSTSTADAPSFNFADRNCTNKDLYSVSGRVFNQGAYWDVPEGVTGITIQPYWAKAAYVADAYPDVVYNTDMSTAYNVPNVGGGEKYKNNNNYNIAGEQQKVFTTISNAVTHTNGLNKPTGNTVHDYAVVLVGNVHQYTTNNAAIGSNYNYTVTTIDLDHDNEPDYSLMLRDDGRNKLHPAKWDFLNIVGLGMAQKSTGGTGSYNQGIFQPLYWFETTNTSLFRVTQFEYDNSSRIAAPLILQGGVMEQWVSGQSGGRSNNTTYFHVGGNVWFKEFHRGTHQDQTYDSKHPPVSVTGGDYDEFYLTGLYTADVASYADNAECYINGGRFGIVAGAAMEGIGKADGADNTGNITWQVQNADIREFYAGGINAANPVTGNLNTTITGGKIDLFCGGPKFGDMSTGKTVTTNATNCIFGTFFGAGYGGNSYSRQAPRNHNNMINFPHNDSQAGNDASWNAWLDRFYKQAYSDTYGGVSTQFSYQFLPMSQNKDNCGRIFVEYVKFSLATCRNVTSTLTGCKITGNFYGGGSLGKVDGPVASTLTNCEVQGSVFGAGFSASLPSVEVDATGFATEPFYYTDLGTYREGVKGPTTTYTWEKKTGNSWVDNTNHILYTTEDLTALGTVTGKATLNINGTTTVTESVYGGGEESGVGGDTEVNVTGGTIGTTGKGGATYGNVYGGGKGKDDDVNAGLVKGNTNITISGTADATKIIHNVYGGGAFGSVGTFTYDGTTGLPNGLTANTGTANITITGGTFGSDGKENGMIFGSSRGSEGDPESDDYVDKIAWVGNTNVVIGTQNAESNANPWIKGSVYGGGENGHNYQNGHVTVHSGTIGITDSSVDGGARYSTRGNVYGGGCGTDTFDRGEGDNKKTYYNFNAGIVLGNTQIDIDGGHIVHNVYGGGAMGSVGTYTLDADGTNDIQDGMPLSCAEHTGLCTIKITGGKIGMTNATMTGHGNDGPDDFGHIFGAGRGYSKDPNVYPNIESCAFFNNTDLTIGGTALVCGSVYGGSESGHVMNNTNVTISGGQIGCGEGRTAAYTDSDFASESLSTTNHWTYTAAGMGAPHDQYANMSGTYDYTGDFAYIPEADRKATSEGGLPVATDGRTFYGNVFAGGSGYYPYAPGLWLRSAGHIGGTASVTVSGGHILNNLYGGCEMADIDGAVTVTMTGGTIGVPRTSAQIKANPNSGNIYGAGMGDKRIFFNTSTNVASATVDISNGTVYGAVYGGGEDGHVMGNVTTTISQPAEKTTVIGCDGQSGYDGNVFGAGQGHIGALTAGVVGGNAILSITGGTLNGSAYGGGRIASVGTYFAMATDPRYGKMQAGDDHGCLTVSLTGGTIEQNVYGGCMGTTANVLYGESKNVLVELNKDKTATDRGCAVKGDIFGCNNVNSTPQGDVEVHVYATQNAAATQIANSGDVTTAKVKGRYDVNAVYGGGNLASYNPVTPYDGTSGSKTKVIIEGCALTSIKTVYGGGNAAAVPETDVVIKSAYEIGYLFGGGNGKDDIAPGVPNPGADVGTPDHGTSTYGTGNANTLMEGGLIHEAYGGSNTKGIIKGSINQITDPKDPSVDPGCCELVVEKIVGAGKYADVDGDVNMTLSCQPDRKVNLLFAGADEANVNGNITLNITNGHFGKVFGGNNLGGAIKGKITVKVEETGCQPIKIDDLYLGGNEAAYSVFGYYESEDPVTGKKILKPRTAEMHAITDPTAEGYKAPVANPTEDATHTFPYAQPELNIISCTYIGNVFGGGFGKGAVMYANPTVNVNMVKGLYGDTAVPDMMTELHLDVTKTAPNPDNLGIIRNVFGGGDAANVAGNTTVNIATEANKSAYIIGSVFGGGNAADVLGNTNVTVSGGYVFNGIFGGGYAGNVGTFIERSYTEKTDVGTDTEFDHSSSTHTCIGKPTKCKTGTGKCTVVVDGGQIGPLSVATQGMNRSKTEGGPVPEGWVWGAGQGLVEDPGTHPDTHFTSYVGETDVTIKGNALVMESIIGGGEFGRVLGNPVRQSSHNDYHQFKCFGRMFTLPIRTRYEQRRKA